MLAEKDGFVFPCIFALLPNKKESTYNTLLRKLLEIKPDLNPKTIMVDFEKAAINLLLSVNPCLTSLPFC